VILNLPKNGLRLRFDGPDQRLRLIEVLNFSKSALQYKGTDLVRRNRSSDEGCYHDPVLQGPPFRHVYNRLFGPAYAGEYISPESGHSTGTYVLSYPGLAFSFPLKHQSWSDKADFVSLLSSSAAGPAKSMAIFDGPSWPEARSSLYTKAPTLPRFSALSAKATDTIPDEIEEIIIYGGGKLEARRRASPGLHIILGETTPQDLIAELGPPDAIYRKLDNRISIHAAATTSTQRHPSMSPLAGPQATDTDQSSLQSYTEDSESDRAEGCSDVPASVGAECFYNYFHHGFDALVSFATHRSPPFPDTESTVVSGRADSQLVVTKMLLHCNIPGSYSFNRHRRSRWTIHTGAEDCPTLTSEMPFSDISSLLKETWRTTYQDGEQEKKMQRGMVLNRGWGESPDSSIELLGGFEENAANGNKTGESTDHLPNSSNTDLFGFPGLLFEVLKNDTISCLTVY